MGGENPEVGKKAENSSKFELRKSPVFSDVDSDLDFDINKLERQSKVQNKGHGKPREKSTVDEKFSQLSEMEAYLENREKEEERKDGNDDEVEDTDFFLKILILMKMKGDCLEVKKLKSGKSSRNVKYKDFFGPVESDEDIASDRDDKLGSNKMMKLLKKKQKN
ncbi:hypothetical protein H8959_001451 [Pygathrix nigripes]